MRHLYFSGILSASVFLLLPFSVVAFDDLPHGHPAFSAVEYLQEQGIVSGYVDGTFQPERTVNRAEALKLIIAPLVTTEELASGTGTLFEYIDEDAWYLPYVRIARERGIVDGPPEKTKFFGEQTVVKVEFLKMLQLAHEMNPIQSFGEIRLPLAIDVTDPNAWFYPYVRYGIASSMLTDTGISLSPGEDITRGQAAQILHALLMYKQGERDQKLLDEVEREIIVVLDMLEQKNIIQAEYASARALLAARGVHILQPTESIVHGAVKIAEAFRAIVRAYRAGLMKNYEDAVRLAGDGWNLAVRAGELSAELQEVGDKVQAIAKNLADSARKAMEEESEASSADS